MSWQLLQETKLNEGLWLAWNGSGVGFGPKSSGLCESKPCSGLCQELLFYSHFITAMIGLGILGVKTGNVGEIRKDCGSSDDNSVYSISNKQTVYGFVL
uniref:Uncharacterized protein n=1 Tax=Salix viminalis TaxID=40686 RepID=A0A6N2LX79_SALVM